MLAAYSANTASPRQAAIDFLVKRHAVPVLALARDGDGHGQTLGEAFITVDDRNVFEFADPPHGEDTMRALIIVARDESGCPLDLVAWAPKTNAISTYFCRCPVLGAHALNGARLNEPLRVHKSVLAWLRADRNGIVILDSARAWRFIDSDLLIGAADVEHGIELRRVLQPPPARIVVPSLREAA